ncbi:hypothetical protein FD977_02395 [Polynucleobacter sp. AP-Elch-400A-B2]|uniref:hypothetical protein n=1 Tax=Polynucleobacter sp. AP-Elch-400A-B2 TaxID=2576930 RepID=UPI001BFDD88F|nr:hypothetical protein [Polynucleobacter sp. AP-Elch-400A-B2]QWE25130.1 hypothetical protein FD977_02395 [Polynucleobacter sp. AP-Elch-400A-B2]
MAAINTSISHQSQFAPSGVALNDMRTKSGAQSQMEKMKGVELKPTSTKFQVQNTVPLGDLGKHVNLKV